VGIDEARDNEAAGEIIAADGGMLLWKFRAFARPEDSTVTGNRNDTVFMENRSTIGAEG
jgi:hypothetical protein